MSRTISPSLEDYLEAVYHLRNEEGKTRVTDIASRLRIAKSSVNKAISILSERRYIVHERYGLIGLTPAGEKAAREVIEKHTAVMDLLVRVLGVQRDIAEEEACKIEHVIGDSTLQKILAFTESFET